jgi:hypothetical protein
MRHIIGEIDVGKHEEVAEVERLHGGRLAGEKARCHGCRTPTEKRGQRLDLRLSVASANSAAGLGP